MKTRTRTGRSTVRKKRGSKVLRLDPTRTQSLRRSFAAKVKRAFARLRLAIVKLVAEEDAFGIGPPPTLNAAVPVINRRFAFHTSPEKIKAFQEWLRQQFQSEITGLTDEQLWKRYIEEGYRKGAGRAFDDTKRAEKALAEGKATEAGGPTEPLDFYRGTREEFLRSSFAQPVAQEKVELLAGRTFDDLEGVTDTMSTRMSRVLTDGLVQGKGPREVARDMAKEVDVGRDRALMIARTELIRAHSEGQLLALESLGVEEVGVMVEWIVTDDDRLCPKCEAMEGVVLKLDEAKGMIPLHPNCRCTWIPANVGEDKQDQVRGKSAIDEALDEAGIDDVEVARERPRSILNQRGNMACHDSDLRQFSAFVVHAFCPTGEGGGVDPSCSPGKAAPRKERVAALEKEVRQAVASEIDPQARAALLTRLGREDSKDVLAIWKKAGLPGKPISKVEAVRALDERLAAPAPSAKRPTIPAPPEAASHLADRLASLDAAGGGHNLVHLGNLRAALGWSRADFDRALDDARRAGKVSLQAAEGRHGVTERDREAAVYEEGGVGTASQSMLLYASLRR